MSTNNSTNNLDERALLAALKAMGLDISPQSNYDGWGYTWLHRDWVGPFSSPLAAIHAAFTAALLAFSQVRPVDTEEKEALELVQNARRSFEAGELQEGRAAHLELNRLLDGWAKTVVDRWVQQQERGNA